MQGDPKAEPVFEIFDLTDGQHTRVLPVVDGTAASFRHYSGVPICMRGGLRIGTLFVFKNKPATSTLSRHHRHFMHETARQIVDQVYLSVEALQSKRALRCDSAVLSLLDICEERDTTNALRFEKTAGLQDHCSHIYQNAARLLSHAFELDGVFIQELPRTRFYASTRPLPPKSLLGQHCRSEESAQYILPLPVAEQLLAAFPSGAVCHLLHSADGCNSFAASHPNDPKFNTNIDVDFQRTYTGTVPEQFLFLPLRDTYHDCDCAFILGWSMGSTRVYSSTTDLLPLSSFGVTIMSQVRRVEEQMLNRKKNDFLGSVSHEMRSPLHGVLACIDLAREAESRAQQLELLDNARSCALQLGDNIDNILMYSNIGSPNSRRKQHKQLRVTKGEAELSQNSTTSADAITKPPETNVMVVLEDVCAKERSMNMSMTVSVESRAGVLPIVEPIWQTVVIADVTPSADLSLDPQSNVRVIVSHLLVSSSRAFMAAAILAVFMLRGRDLGLTIHLLEKLSEVHRTDWLHSSVSGR